MTKKIFHSILLVAGTVLLASLLVIMGCLYEYFGSVEKKQLHDELELAAVAVEENGTEYLSQLSSERYRLTWIENDGTVLYDTVTDAESLENHADRVEVKQALEYGEGDSTRYSSTLLQKTMYCAGKARGRECAAHFDEPCDGGCVARRYGTAHFSGADRGADPVLCFGQEPVAPHRPAAQQAGP